jgi:hypothetical protein
MQQERPTAILVICVYEVLVGLYGLASQALATLSMYMVAHSYHYGTVQSLVGIVSALVFAVLSFCIAFFVWKRLLTAFALSLIKLILGVLSTVSVFYVMFARGILTNPYLMHSTAFLVSFWLPRIIGIMTLVLSLVITIYLYRAALASNTLDSKPEQWLAPPQERS